MEKFWYFNYHIYFNMNIFNTLKGKYQLKVQIYNLQYIHFTFTLIYSFIKIH